MLVAERPRDDVDVASAQGTIESRSGAVVPVHARGGKGDLEIRWRAGVGDAERAGLVADDFVRGAVRHPEVLVHVESESARVGILRSSGTR